MIASTQQNWTRQQLGTVANVISGYAFKSSDFGSSGVPVIKIRNIRVGAVDLSEVDRVADLFLKIPDRYHIKAGDILISLTGSHISQPNSVVGRVARHSAGLPLCLLNQRAGKVIVKDSSYCDKSFLFYALSEKETMRAIALKAQGAANQANVSPSQVESIEITLPSLHMQRRIASILSAYDNLIENNARRIAILEEMARRLYDEWFVHFRFPGYERVRMVESQLGLIPEGWNPSNLSNIIEKSGRKYSDNLHSKLPLVDLARIPRRSNALIEVGDANEIKTSRIVFDSGEILFGAIRPYFHKVLLAPFGGVTNVSVHVFKAKLGVPPSFVYSMLFSDDAVAWATQHSGGMKMPVIGWEVFQKMPVAIPPTYLLADFDRLISPMLAMLTILVRKNFPLRATRELLLPKLISGEIDVSDFPEPETVAA